MATYTTENEFHRYAPQARAHIDPLRIILGWTTAATFENVSEDFDGIDAAFENVGTENWRAEQTGNIQQLFRDKRDLGAAQSSLANVDSEDQWYYDSTNDVVYLNSTQTITEQLMESGEDHSTYMTWLLAEASSIVDEMLDVKFSIPMKKDRAGTYPKSVIRATAYVAAHIVTLDTDADLAAQFISQVVNETDTGIVDMLLAGKIKLPGEVDWDSARGELEEVSISGVLYPVDIRGRYTGPFQWDNLKIAIVVGGAVGTATFNVWQADGELKTLKSAALFSTAETITGLYQPIGNGLEIRWGGITAATATTDDEWELEVFISTLRPDNTNVTHAFLTRL